MSSSPIPWPKLCVNDADRVTFWRIRVLLERSVISWPHCAMAVSLLHVAPCMRPCGKRQGSCGCLSWNILQNKTIMIYVHSPVC